MKPGIKSLAEIQTMRDGGRILAEIFEQLKEASKPGITTWDLEVLFIDLCKKYQVRPACKDYAPHGYPPYPAGLCIGVNNQALHNFPSKKIHIKNTDLLKIDTVIEYSGYYLDSAIAIPMPDVSSTKKRLLKVANMALEAAINQVHAGARVGQVSHAMQSIVESAGYSVVRDYAGHGIGTSMHEDPTIPCYGNIKQGPTLEAGMTICIEPLICEGNHRLKHKGYWETETLDGLDFIQVEHTVLVTNDGFEILTK